MNKIQIEKLNLFYGNFHALKNVELDIKDKEITAFIGPSGCGKSTILRTINRMVKPDAGRITWKGEDLLKMSSGEA